MEALRIEPLLPQTAAGIAAQVASALEYLHDKGIHHGQVGTRSVLLLENPRKRHLTAKLGNFALARLRVKNTTLQERDTHNFGVLIYNLFAKNYSGGASLQELARLSLDQLKGCVVSAEVGQLLHSIFSSHVSVKAAAARLAGLRREYDQADGPDVDTSQSALYERRQSYLGSMIIWLCRGPSEETRATKTWSL
jgi:serine/threonine protein kinase